MFCFRCQLSYIFLTGCGYLLTDSCVCVFLYLVITQQSHFIPLSLVNFTKDHYFAVNLHIFSCWLLIAPDSCVSFFCICSSATLFILFLGKYHVRPIVLSTCLMFFLLAVDIVLPDSCVSVFLYLVIRYSLFPSLTNFMAPFILLPHLITSSMPIPITQLLTLPSLSLTPASVATPSTATPAGFPCITYLSMV